MHAQSCQVCGLYKRSTSNVNPQHCRRPLRTGVSLLSRRLRQCTAVSPRQRTCVATCVATAEYKDANRALGAPVAAVSLGYAQSSMHTAMRGVKSHCATYAQAVSTANANPTGQAVIRLGTQRTLHFLSAWNQLAPHLPAEVCSVLVSICVLSKASNTSSITVMPRLLI